MEYEYTGLRKNIKDMETDIDTIARKFAEFKRQVGVDTSELTVSRS